MRRHQKRMSMMMLTLSVALLACEAKPEGVALGEPDVIERGSDDAGAVDDAAHGGRGMTSDATSTEPEGADSEAAIEPNQPPEVTILAPQPGAVMQVGEATTLRGRLSDDLDDAVQLSARWSSDLSGDLGMSPVGDDGITTLTLSNLASGEHTLTLSAQDSQGLEASAQVSISVNAPPGAPEVTISPTTPRTEDELSVTVVSLPSDPNRDSDDLTLTYAWYKNGVLEAGFQGPKVLSNATTKGDTWQVQVTAFDGSVFGAEASAEVTIGNTAPSCTEVALTPLSGDTITPLSCGCTTRLDPDNDPLQDTCTFSADGLPLTTIAAVDGTCVLPASLTSRDTQITCSYQPGDGESSGEPITSESAVITNTLPTIQGVSVVPTSPSTCSVLTCVVDAIIDIDEDATELIVHWLRNGESVAEGSDTLWLDDLLPGDTMSCIASAADQSGEQGPPVTSESVTVINSPPTLDSVSLEPKVASVGETLSCVPEGFTDPDCDNEPGYVWAWYLDGVLIEGQSSADLDTSNLAPNVSVSCSVSPTDGLTVGESVSSAPVTVANNPPSLPVVALEAPDGADGTLSCVISEAASDDEPLSLDFHWQINGAQAFVDGPSLSAESVSHCDLVACWVTASDGLVEVASLKATLLLPLGAECDDANPCTNSSCAPTGGCVTDFNTAFCDDGDACTTDDICAGGSCSGVNINPDDGIACTIDTCEPTIGVVNTPDHGACASAQLCITDTCDVTQGCISAPTPQCCGNGTVEQGESCDTSGTFVVDCAYGLTDCEVCSASCELVPGVVHRCGDGVVDSVHGEVCDDGDDEPMDGCSIDCQLECPVGQTIVDEGCAVCPDGSVSPGGVGPCVACQPGQAPNTEQSTCIPCLPGTHSPEGLACVDCPDCVPCQDCPPGDLSATTPIEHIVGDEDAPALNALEPVEVVLDRGFICLDEGVGTEMLLAEDSSGGQVVIISKGECFYDLVYRSGDGDEVLSDSPGAFILASAEHFPASDVTLVCASDVRHEAGTAEPNERLIQSVVIHCWARQGSASFTGLSGLVTPEGADDGVTSQYAAWVDSITPVGDTQDQWSVGWKRDFSFQFLNISDAGRPPSDGAYATALGFDGEVLVAGVTTKLSDSILGEPPTASAWSPSVEERGMLDGLFDIQNGPCVDGCLAE